jgi:hypothetical protein
MVMSSIIHSRWRWKAGEEGLRIQAKPFINKVYPESVKLF